MFLIVAVAEAAVAVQLALAVVEPQHVSLLGGGGLLFSQPGLSIKFLDFREEAPESLHANSWCKGSSCAYESDPNCNCSGGAWRAERFTG